MSQANVGGKRDDQRSGRQPSGSGPKGQAGSVGGSAAHRPSASTAAGSTGRTPSFLNHSRDVQASRPAGDSTSRQKPSGTPGKAAAGRAGDTVGRPGTSKRTGNAGRLANTGRASATGRTGAAGRAGATGRIPKVKPTTRTGRRGVVGAKVDEVSGKLQGRGLPKGGIRGTGTLTVDKQALGQKDRRRDVNTGKALKVVIIVVGVLLVLLVAFLVAITLLSHTSAFTITEVDADDSAHVTADSIVRLANVQDGSTLLNVDTDAIQKNLERNPWILSANITREFPDKLKIIVTERQPAYLVVMGTGNLAWYLGPDNIWIEPKRIEVSGDQSVTDAAMSLASQTGSVVITDVPSSVSPVAGSACTDDEILTVVAFQQQFSDDMKSQIVCYSAPETNSVSCVLSSGVQVSLGAASNIDSKETVIKQVLQEYAGQITYLNVRVPSKPSYRGLSSDSNENLTSGTGANGTSTEDGTQFTDQVADVDGKVSSSDSGSSDSSSDSGSSSGSGSSGSGSSSGSSSGSTSPNSSSGSGSGSSSSGSSSGSTSSSGSSSSTAAD